MENSATIPVEIIAGYKWSFLSEATYKIITPLVFLVLARLLEPDNFGIIAFATLLINFAQILWDSGLSKALIQRQTDTVKAAHAVFYHNLMIGVLIYGLLFLAADGIARIFGDPQLANVLRIQGLQIIIASTASVQAALLQLNMDFKSLFRIRVIAVILSAFVSIGLASIGWRYWALVAGILSAEISKAAVLWLKSSWRPRWQYDHPLAVQLWRVGVWIFLEEMLAWFIVWGDSAIVGYYLGSYELGLYRTGSLIVMMVLGALLDPMVPVMFSALSRVQRNEAKFYDYMDRMLKFFIIIALPTAAALFALRQPIVDFVLGEKWDGIQPVIGCFAVATGISYTVSALPAAFRASGKTRSFAKLRVFSVSFILPAYLISITFGLRPFLYTRIAVTVLTLLAYAATVRYVFQYSLMRFFKSFSCGLFWAGALSGAVLLLEYFLNDQVSFSYRLLVIIPVLGSMVFHVFWMSKDQMFFRQFAKGLFKFTKAGEEENRTPGFARRAEAKPNQQVS